MDIDLYSIISNHQLDDLKFGHLEFQLDNDHKHTSGPVVE